MAMSQKASAATGTTAMMASCQADNAEFGDIGFYLSSGFLSRSRTETTPSTCQASATMSRPAATVSGSPSRVTIPLETVTVNWSGSAKNSFWITFLMISRCISVSGPVDAQHVGPADDPDQLALFSDHRKALYPALVHKAGGAGDRLVRRHHDRRFGHEAGGGHGGRLGEFIAIS